MLVVNVDRSRTLTSRFSPIRRRLHGVTVGAAMALLAGLSAPAMAAATDMAVSEQSNASAASGAATDLVASAAGATAAGVTAAAPAGAIAAQPAKPAAKAAPKPAAKKIAPPTAKQMHPRGIYGQQQKFAPTKAQLQNARAIVDTGKKMGLPPRAWVIAVGTALQESTLNNFGDLGANNDHDSLGLFQQRPSAGWGSPKQLQNPAYASTAFYKGLVSVPNWNRLPLTAAAQTVQVSAFPNHYAKWEAQAGYLVSAFHGDGPYAKLAAGIK